MITHWFINNTLLFTAKSQTLPDRNQQVVYVKNGKRTKYTVINVVHVLEDLNNNVYYNQKTICHEAEIYLEECK
jgi:hypothetical protein